MRFLKVIGSTKWSLIAALEEVDGKESCPLLDDFDRLEAEGGFGSSIDGMLVLMDHVADVGPMTLPDKLCHEVNKDPTIFQFIKGRLRVLWFYGADNKVVVCSHCFVKKDQKTPKPEIHKCIGIRERYLSAHADRNIELLEELEE